MSDLTIECPKCHYPFELTEALAGPISRPSAGKRFAEAEQRFAAEAERIAQGGDARLVRRATPSSRTSKAAKRRREGQSAKAREAEARRPQGAAGGRRRAR